MSLQAKYQQIIEEASAAGATNMGVNEENGVLFISAAVPNAAVHDKLFEIYNEIDPNMATGDLVLNLEIANEVAGATCIVTTEETALNVRSGPSTNDAVIGYAEKDLQVTLLEKTNEQWWKIRTATGIEGYSYSQYLTAQ